MKFNRFVSQFGKYQGATRYSFTDDTGNSVTFSPEETLEIIDFLNEHKAQIKHDSLIDNQLREEGKIQSSEPSKDYQAIETAIQLLTAHILELRTELLVIKANTNKLIDQKE